MSEPNSNIFNLIAKYSKGEISEQEYLELKAWLKENENNKAIFSEYLVFFKKVNRVSFNLGVDKERAWEIIRNKLEKRNAFKIQKLLRFAAIFFAPVILAITIFIVYQHQNIESIVADVPAIEPGESKATLVLGDGSEITLEALGDSTIELAGGMSIIKNKEVIDYQGVKVEKEEMNTIRIPRGGEYTLVLSDGTKVWLNSDSELTYPVTFLGETREIMLKGEAYLEVAENKAVPFVVNVGSASVEVLGTAFNVKAYSDEDHIETTLVEGSVKMFSEGYDAVVLKPGEQGVSITGQKKIVIKQVETEYFTAWKDGIFAFKSLSLEEIMATFERWYDVEVSYAGETLKQLHFTGKLERYQKINPHLDLITLTTDVEFEIKEDEIIVKNKSSK